MKRLATLTLTFLAISPLQSFAVSLEVGPTSGLYTVMHGTKVEVLLNHRTIAAVDSAGRFLGVFDPLYDGDAGQEGTIVSIRAATARETNNFPSAKGEEYVVLRYSTGDLLVISVHGSLGLKPSRCDSMGPDVVNLNIACKLDLEKARRQYTDALIAKTLRPGPDVASLPPLNDYIVPDSGIVLRFGDDRRTILASDRSGHQLWREDPFDVAGLKPYRYFKPLISFVRPIGDKAPCATRGETAVGLGYSSTQFGCLNPRTGQFELLGQD